MGCEWGTHCWCCLGQPQPQFIFLSSVQLSLHVIVALPCLALLGCVQVGVQPAHPSAWFCFSVVAGSCVQVRSVAAHTCCLCLQACFGMLRHWLA